MTNSSSSVSLCMIVRDSSATLRPCLDSVRPYVDELVVVDTGSRDDTRSVAASFGARVYDFPWVDDFAVARNVSLQHATGQWIFWMDSDDTISEANGRGLRNLVDGPHESHVLGYVLQVHCPGKCESDLTVVDHVKLFRNHPQIRFEGRIHEQVIPSIRALGGDIAWTDIFVTHSGSDQSPAGRKVKCERDLRILDKDLVDRPEHPFVLFNLGMTYSDMEEYDRAVPFLERSLAASQSHESHVRKLYALLVAGLAHLGRQDAAWSACQEGRSHFPDDAELLFRQALLEHEFGRFQDAADSYQTVLYRQEGIRHFSSVDHGIGGFKARHNLALVYLDLGRDDVAELQWRHVLAEQPDFAPAQRGLGQCLLKQQRYSTLGATLASISDDKERRLLEAELAATTGDLECAKAALRQTVADFPTDAYVHEVQSRILFDRGTPAEAIESLLALRQLRPDDGSVGHNLGILHLSNGTPEKAVAEFEHSLAKRPNSKATEEQLVKARQLLENGTE